MVPKQSEIDKEVNKTEAIVSFTESVLEFMKQEPGDALEMTLAKLEAPKTMLEPTIENALKEDSEFYQLIQIAKTTKDAVENLHKEDQYEYDDNYEDGEELKLHYWGGEDGNELIVFED